MTRVSEIMVRNPSCCTPDTNLKDVARMMVDCDCGEIPVVGSIEGRKPVGVITDRDICCRSVAMGKNPLELTTRDCMTRPAIVATEDMSLDSCCDLMKSNQIRRMPVIDASERVVGIIAQADIVSHMEDRATASMIKEISKPAETSSTNLPQ